MGQNENLRNVMETRNHRLQSVAGSLQSVADRLLSVVDRLLSVAEIKNGARMKKQMNWENQMSVTGADVKNFLI